MARSALCFRSLPLPCAGPGQLLRWAAGPRGGGRLLAQTELLHNTLVALGVVVLQVVQKASAPVYHLDQTAPGRMVLGVGLEVAGQAFDPLAQERNLHLWRPSVAAVQAMLTNQR